MKARYKTTVAVVIVIAVAAAGLRSYLMNRQSRLQQGAVSPAEFMNRSIKSMTDAAAKDPKDPSGYFKLGNFYLEHKKIDEAAEAFKSALKINPKHGPALENLGLALYRKKDFDGALNYLQQAAELIPDSASLHDTMGGVYREKKMYQKALEEHQKASALQKDAPDSLYNIALVYQEMKSPEERRAWERYLALASAIPSEAHYVEIARKNLEKLGKSPR